MPKSDRPNRYEIWDQRPLHLDSFAAEEAAEVYERRDLYRKRF